jgi:NAD(P)-dependent dehydrogenase (short-subunit alcohol dehydrogenase family)
MSIATGSQPREGLQMGRVQGKVAIVTGGASNPGLGRATALALGREGARVIVTDIDLGGAERTAGEIRESGGDAIALRQDVTQEEGWKTIVAHATKTFGRLDVLVNNAGIAVLKLIEDMTLADWNRQIEVNLTSVFLGCKYGVAAMRASGGGSIVNISSVAGIVGLATCVAYGASKGGVRILSKSVAVEGARYNIRCNSVHPGFIWTNMQAQAQAGRNDPPASLSSERVPLGRMGTPEDIANCVLYLASDESSYVTGAELTVDAGMTAV